MSKYTRLTEKEFKQIKLLQEAGINSNKAAEITGRSGGTVWTIYHYPTFQEYKEANRKSNESAESNENTHGDDIVKILANMAEMLSEIGKKVSFIEGHTEVKTTNKSWLSRN